MPFGEATALASKSSPQLPEHGDDNERFGAEVSHEIIEEESSYVPYSLHELVSLRDMVDPQLAELLITRLAPVGEVVCDPMDVGGCVPVESLRLKRRPIAVCQSDLVARITRAKCEPIDIAAATLLLQRLSFSLPVDMDYYREHFAPFFDVETYREITSARTALSRLGSTRETRFIEAALLGILHGHSASYLSASTSPTGSLAPVSQGQLNRSRGQAPCYRSVSPRLLRRVALACRDCHVNLFSYSLPKGDLSISDPRNLTNVRTGSVGLVCTRIPIPATTVPMESQWLRSWFIGKRENSWTVPALNGGWESFIAECLAEQARIVRRGGAAALIIPAFENNELITHTLINVVSQNLASMWRLRAILDVGRQRQLSVRTVAVKRQRVHGQGITRVLVLER